MSIPLFWWSSKQLYKSSLENYGDLMSKYLVEKIAENKTHWVQPKKIKWYQFNKTNYAVIGSILEHVTKHSIVWGSGIIQKTAQVANATFLAVRGPETRARLQELGYQCPEVYGDPGLLMSKYYNPNVEKTKPFGIIPHYVDYDLVHSWYKDDDSVSVINLRTNDVEATTREILACEHILSSSLHGVIISHAYQIPAVWVQFSDKLYGDNIKFKDYFSSVGLPNYKASFISNKMENAAIVQEIHSKPNLPEEAVITNLQNGLMATCPFIHKTK